VIVIIDGGDPLPGHIVDGAIVLEEPGIPDDLTGTGLPIVITVNPGTPEAVTLDDTVNIVYGGEGEQWVTVREIVAPPVTANDVILSWDRGHIDIRGTLKYVIYTSETLERALGSWTPVDTVEDASLVEFDHGGFLRDLVLWHGVTLKNRGTDDARFFRVKAVRVGD
ncbi:MAG: hypothetical protein FWF84_03885, partial [Kiritimatiellaeota bacterium]|nr:hypothetical protein [Kiritimatiellota bacterium]